MGHTHSSTSARLELLAIHTGLIGGARAELTSCCSTSMACREQAHCVGVRR